MARLEMVHTLTVRFKRWDLAMSGLSMLHSVPASSDEACSLEGFSMIKSLLLGLVGLSAVSGVLHAIARLSLGYWTYLHVFWFAGHLGWSDIFVRFWLLSPLVDIAETVRLMADLMIATVTNDGRPSTS